MNTWLLTGATGTLGRELLWDLLAAGDAVRCVVRAGDAAEAEKRIDELIARRPQGPIPAEQRERVRAVRGDLTQPLLGLSQPEYDALAREVTGVIHGAANVNFTQALHEARKINVEGTRQVLAFAERAMDLGGLHRFEHISTAYVAGDRRGRVLETEGYVGQKFHNTYEQTKSEAERLIEEHRGRLPIALLRPSIVVGDSRTGYTSSFKVMYWPLKIFAGGWVWVIPADPDGGVDLVPVDYVVDVMRALRARPESVGRTVHIAAGDMATSIGAAARLASGFFDVRVPKMMPPKVFDYTLRPVLYASVGLARTEQLRRGRVYIPYLAHGARFDTRVRDELVGLPAPSVDAYFERLLRYCIESDWGKKDPRTPRA